MLNRLLPISIVTIFSLNGYAAEKCNTLPECEQLKTELSASLAAVNARIQAPQPSPFGDIVRNADGSIRYMNQADAINYCASQGQHLPSARELAALSQSMGAAGISETAKNGYYQVNARNADGKTDSFYFSSEGYNRPAGDLGNNPFWSSSIPLINPADNGLNLVGQDGSISGYFRTYYFAVRCARGQ
jgi:hypothetical protein